MITSEYSTSTASTSSSSSSSTSSTSNSSVDKTQFLELLVAQIKNQDPLNPMDNQEFTAQMATFSSLEQLMSVNENLGMMLSASNSANSTQAVSLIGKEVTASGHNVHVENGNASNVSFNLPSDASAVTINIEDANGNVVRTIENGAMGSGAQAIVWDGKDDYGTPLADGLYSYSVEATDTTGSSLDVTTYTTGVVTGVTFEGDVAYIQIGDLKFMLSEISQVAAASGSSTGSAGQPASSSTASTDTTGATDTAAATGTDTASTTQGTPAA